MNFRCILLTFMVFQIFSLLVFSQPDTIWLGRSLGLQLSGFARVDYILDSRQTSEAVEGLFSFYPSNRLLDANGKDINAVPKANFISVASRLASRFYAPDMFNSKSTAYIEFDFTGTSNTNGVRLRQAYINFSWEKSNLLLGRAWHPLSAACLPTVLSLNTGAPFWAFNRSDQIRFDYEPQRWLLSAAAVYQSDYASLGPVSGTAATSVKSSTYMRDALLPEFIAHVAYKTSNFQLGTLGSIKTIKPRMFTMPDYSNPNSTKYKTDEKLITYSLLAYSQYRIENLTVKAQASYAQNTTESLMIGGYAVSAIDPVTGHEKYTPTQYMNYWINIVYGKKWQVALFAGYLNSMGTLENVTGAWYARAHDIKYMYRVSSSVFYNVNNFQIATELEYTAAAFGTVQNSQKAKITNASEVANLRASMMMYFFF